MHLQHTQYRGMNISLLHLKKAVGLPLIKDTRVSIRYSGAGAMDDYANASPYVTYVCNIEMYRYPGAVMHHRGRQH